MQVPTSRTICMNQYIWRAHQRHATADRHRLFFFAPMSITERELPIHSGQKHVGALLGVDAVETMVADVQGGTSVLAGVALDIEHQAAEPYPLARRDAWQSRLAGHTLPLSLPGQPLLLLFFPPVVCEPVMLSC